MANYSTCVKCDNEFVVVKWKDINICPMCKTATLVTDIDGDTIVPDVDLNEEYSPDDYDSIDYYEKGTLGDLQRYIDDLE